MTQVAQSVHPRGRSRGHGPTSFDRHIGAKLRERRVLVGLSQSELAELLGVTYQQEFKYERGINRVTASRLFNASKALDVPITYFFEGFENLPEVPVINAARKELVIFAQLYLSLPHKARRILQEVAKYLQKGE